MAIAIEVLDVKIGSSTADALFALQLVLYIRYVLFTLFITYKTQNPIRGGSDWAVLRLSAYREL